MTDLTRAQWRDIEKASRYFKNEALGRFIGLGELRTILRKSRRTNPQNALLWSLYGDILRLGGEQLGGWTTAELHDFFLGEHFGWEIREGFGKKKQIPRRRSSRLTKTEFSEYVDAVVQKCAEFGIVLELPGEKAA